jgi:hypothetical protein
MLWTLSASLLVMTLTLIQFLKKVVDKVKAIYFVYPSDAVVDQVLPQEITEHIMTFLDPRAMIECRLVSKYWNHHANKPNVEKEVRQQAKQRVREVFDELNRKGLEITDQVIEGAISEAPTDDTFFLRAAAIASKHGAELLVAGPLLLNHLFAHTNWKTANSEKKYFALTTMSKGQSPWQFSGSHVSFGAVPQFDKNSVDWDDTPTWSSAEVLIDTSTLPTYYQNNVNLYFYRPTHPPKYFYFIPLNEKVLHVLLFLLAPMIVHDALYASYLPTIKSWFGPITFIASIVIQLLIMRVFTRHYQATKEFKILVAAFFASYLFFTWLAYPVSLLSVFAGIGIQSLMFMYIMFSKQYFGGYNGVMTKKKWQTLAVGVLLLFLMVDWKLVVDSTRDLSIFRTLFDNTVCYCIILLHFIFDNFLGYCQRDGFRLEFLTKWDTSTIRTLQRSYGLVIWMTLVAPTWQGNHV